MGVSHSSCLTLATDPCFITSTHTPKPKIKSKSKSNSHSPSFTIVKPHFLIFTRSIIRDSFSSKTLPLKCGNRIVMGTKKDGVLERPFSNLDDVKEDLVEKMVYDALVWCSLHGLLVGDRNVERSGKVPGVGLVHAPFALLPTLFPESYWRQACDVAPIFNELFDRVSLDGQFLQDSLSRTKQVDAFTSRLLDIHSKMLEMNKKEEICLGLHRSDYMLDEQTKLLLQIEFNTISSSFSGLSCLVSSLHRSLLSQYGETLELDSQKVPSNSAVSQFAEALAKAWIEYNNPRAVIVVVVQTEEHNMYDQHWLSTVLREKYDIKMIRKTLAEINAGGKLLPDGTLLIDNLPVAVAYFRAGYTPNDYPSESEWSARLLMEKSSAIKCPSISYHLAGTKKIQQELAKPHVLERFLDNKEDIAKVQKCFAGLWSLDDPDIVNKAIENPELFVMKPQREGGGNNIYGEDVKKALLRLRNEGTQEDAAYILMQRIFPTESPTYMIRDGIWHRNLTISELGLYSAYLRNKDKIIMNEECGYLMRTKMSSSNEGGVAAGFGVLDSIYLT